MADHEQSGDSPRRFDSRQVSTVVAAVLLLWFAIANWQRGGDPLLGPHCPCVADDRDRGVGSARRLRHLARAAPRAHLEEVRGVAQPPSTCAVAATRFRSDTNAENHATTSRMTTAAPSSVLAHAASTIPPTTTPEPCEKYRVSRDPVDDRGAVGLDLGGCVCRRASLDGMACAGPLLGGHASQAAGAPRRSREPQDERRDEPHDDDAPQLPAKPRRERREHCVGRRPGARWSATSRTACRCSAAPASRRRSRRRRCRARSRLAGASGQGGPPRWRARAPPPTAPSGASWRCGSSTGPDGTRRPGRATPRCAGCPSGTAVRSRAGGSPCASSVVIAARSCGVTSRPSWPAFCSLEPLLVIAVTNAECRRRSFAVQRAWNFGEARTVEKTLVSWL